MIINYNRYYKNASIFDKNACFSTQSRHFSIHTFDKVSFNLYNEATKLKEAFLCQTQFNTVRLGITSLKDIQENNHIRCLQNSSQIK